jgi:glycosyltransferase involved in cell wall biosynthesis
MLARSLSRSAAPLKILLFCTRFGVGGIARHALELGAWLRERGHRVTFGGTPGAWLDADKDPGFVALDAYGVSGGDHGFALSSRLSSLTRSALYLRRWLYEHPVDLIHAHESAPALVARLATLGRAIPIVLTFHGAEPERMRQYAKIAQASATQVISVSGRGAQQLASLGVRKSKIASIGLGIRPLPESDADRVDRLRKDLLGTEGHLLVVTIARLSYQKGIDTLIAVADRVGKIRSDIHFVVVGDGPLEESLREQVESQGVADRLRFAGRSDEPALYLRAADLFLLTSRWEALPYTIIEAFQAGLPAIATDCGGVAELIDMSVGRVVPIGDVEAITYAVLALAQDTSLRARMSAVASLRALEDRFKPEVVHKRIEALYYEVLQRMRQRSL